LHYIPDYEGIIKRHEFYNEEPRKSFVRKKHKKFSRSCTMKAAKRLIKNEETTNLTFTKYYNSKIYGTLNSKEDFMPEDSNEEIPDLEFYSFNDKKENCYSIKEEEIKEIPNSNEIEQILSKANMKVKNEIPSTTHFSNNHINSLVKSPKESTNHSGSAIDIKKEKEIIIFDRVKNFKAYYPEMNCREIIKSIRKTNFMNKNFNNIMKNCFSEKRKNEILRKFSIIGKYTIFAAKIKELMMHSALRSFKIQWEHNESSPTAASPLMSKKNKNFISFFDRKRDGIDKNFLSLVNSLRKSQKGKKYSLKITNKKALFLSKI